MDEKKMRRLKRIELLEMLVALSEENDALKHDISELRSRLDARELQISNAGSIAEAALAVNGVFESAQEAAAQYLDNICRMSGKAQETADKILAEATEQCEEMKRLAQEEVDKKWDELAVRLSDYCSLHEELSAALPLGLFRPAGKDGEGQ